MDRRIFDAVAMEPPNSFGSDSIDRGATDQSAPQPLSPFHKEALEGLPARKPEPPAERNAPYQRTDPFERRDPFERKEPIERKNPYHYEEIKPYTFNKKVMNVARPIGHGAWNEITEHYGRVALSGAVGFGIGYGMAFVPPQYKNLITVAGLVVGGVALATRVPTWYDSVKTLTDHRSSAWRKMEAERVMEGFGGGAVDLTAGIVGGALGSRMGMSYKMELDKPVRFDRSGRPIKMPLPEDGGSGGSAYIKYDRDGQVVRYVEQYKSGWRNVLERNPNPQGGKQYIGFTDLKSRDLYTDKIPWSAEFTPSKTGLTYIDENGVTTLRTDGASTFVQTAEQIAKAAARKAAFKAEYEAAAKMAEELARRSAGRAAGIGMGMGVGIGIR